MGFAQDHTVVWTEISVVWTPIFVLQSPRSTDHTKDPGRPNHSDPTGALLSTMVTMLPLRPNAVTWPILSSRTSSHLSLWNKKVHFNGRISILYLWLREWFSKKLLLLLLMWFSMHFSVLGEGMFSWTPTGNVVKLWMSCLDALLKSLDSFLCMKPGNLWHSTSLTPGHHGAQV